MVRPEYYLNDRLVDKKDIPKTAIFDKRVDRKAKWGGKKYKIKEYYYKTNIK
jgi:hypothetical protein